MKVRMKELFILFEHYVHGSDYELYLKGNKVDSSYLIADESKAELRFSVGHEGGFSYQKQFPFREVEFELKFIKPPRALHFTGIPDNCIDFIKAVNEHSGIKHTCLTYGHSYLLDVDNCTLVKIDKVPDDAIRVKLGDDYITHMKFIKNWNDVKTFPSIGDRYWKILKRPNIDKVDFIISEYIYSTGELTGTVFKDKSEALERLELVRQIAHKHINIFL